MRPRNSVLLVMTGIIVCRAGAARAQRPSVEPTKPGAAAELLQESWPRVSMDIRVLDRNDQPVLNIDSGQISVRDTGTEVQGAQLMQVSGEPQSVCLLIDNSGSSYDQREAILDAANAVLQTLPAQDEACLMNFAIKGYVDAEMTTDRQRVSNAMKYFRPSGGSALRDVLIAAVKYMGLHATFRSRALILISDGGENASKASEADVERAFASLGAPSLYMILTNGDHEDPRPFLRLVSQTGGVAYKANLPAERRANVETLIGDMSQRYRLVYSAPNSAADGKRHTVTVRLNKDLAKQKMTVSSVRSYYAPER